jgi:pimeloyl-ACP methyl ester carboxylesterase
MNSRTILALPALLVAAGVAAAAWATPRDIAGAVCETPPALHCPDADCPAELITHLGNAVEPKTGRQFFLDYPCHLKRGDKVIFVLSLHGGGSIGNWQRHYFPIMDSKDKYKLVIATPSGTGPNGGTGGWNPDRDDPYLHNIVDLVYAQFGAKNIKAFWLVGHSLGGQTANRLINSDFYRDRLTGWVSLSGGRLGSKRSDIRAPIPSAPGIGPTPGAAPRPAGSPPSLALVADASALPSYSFSHIYVTGEHELTAAGMPDSSRWAEKLACGPRVRGPDVIDTHGGYVYDTRPQTNANPIWGFKARPGTAEVFIYPNCAKGAIVADIIRMDKGHTEGLEPKITEEIVKLMVSAR